jgi:hypothetical protein
MVLGTKMMRSSLIFVSLLLLFGVFALFFYYQRLWRDNVKILEYYNGIVVTQSNCYTTLKKTEDGTSIYRENTCLNDKALWKTLASDVDLASKIFDGTNRLYLGNARFSEGPFDVCDIFYRLSKDPDWTSEINSVEAATVLERVIPDVKLFSTAQATLESVGISINSVSLETVILTEGAYIQDCPDMEPPKKLPTSALLDINFGKSHSQ